MLNLPQPASRVQPLLLALIWSLIPAALTGLATPVSAASFTLATELDTGDTDIFGIVDVEEIGGNLAFEIQLTDALGPDADLQEFYFNLAGDFTNVSVLDTNAPTTPYTLKAARAVRGGAGSKFDFAVNLGNGAGPRGNGELSLATFTISADQDLAIADLLKSSFAKGGTLEANFASHVQGTELVGGVSSETLIGVVPEPSTTLLVGLGLALLGAARRPSG